MNYPSWLKGRRRQEKWTKETVAHYEHRTGKKLDADEAQAYVFGVFLPHFDRFDAVFRPTSKTDEKKQAELESGEYLPEKVYRKKEDSGLEDIPSLFRLLSLVNGGDVLPQMVAWDYVTNDVLYQLFREYGLRLRLPRFTMKYRDELYDFEKMSQAGLADLDEKNPIRVILRTKDLHQSTDIKGLNFRHNVSVYVERGQIVIHYGGKPLMKLSRGATLSGDDLYLYLDPLSRDVSQHTLLGGNPEEAALDE